MTIFLLTFALLAVVFIAMSIGYIVNKKSIAGSCGGLGALGIAKACNCENPCDRKKERIAKEEQANNERTNKEKSWKENQIL